MNSRMSDVHPSSKRFSIIFRVKLIRMKKWFAFVGLSSQFINGNFQELHLFVWKMTENRLLLGCVYRWNSCAAAICLPSHLLRITKMHPRWWPPVVPRPGSSTSVQSLEEPRLAHQLGSPNGVVARPFQRHGLPTA